MAHGRLQNGLTNLDIMIYYLTWVKIDVEGEESAIVGDLMTADLEYLEGIIELHPDKLDVLPSDVVNDLNAVCSRCEFLAETSSQHEFSRPMYHFVRKKRDLE